MTRRSFLGFLSALPIVGCLFRRSATYSWVEVEFDDGVAACYTFKRNGRSGEVVMNRVVLDIQDNKVVYIPPGDWVDLQA